MDNQTLEYRAKAYWPGTPGAHGDSTILYSGHTTEQMADNILSALLAAGCTGGHLERHVQGIGWVYDETDEPVNVF